jgi:molecular chaperone Hsp33
LQITKINYDSNEPTRGIVPIQVGDVSSDLVYYFTQSEQIPTAFMLDVSLSEDGQIEHSGGLMIQALSGAKDEVLVELSEKLESGISLTNMFKEGKMPRDIFSELLNFDYKLTGSVQSDFYCRCSMDNFKSKLLTLSVNEIKDMKDKQQNELVCKYCNEHYYLEEKDFDELILQAQASVN